MTCVLLKGPFGDFNLSNWLRDSIKAQCIKETRAARQWETIWSKDPMPRLVVVMKAL